MIRAELIRAELIRAELIRAELILAEVIRAEERREVRLAVMKLGQPEVMKLRATWNNATWATWNDLQLGRPGTVCNLGDKKCSSVGNLQ